MNKPLDKFRNIFRITGVDRILIYNQYKDVTDKTFFYLAQPESGVFENSWIIMSPDRAVMLTSRLEESAASETDLEVLTYENRQNMFDILEKEINGNKKIGLNFKALSTEIFFAIKDKLKDRDFIDVSEDILKIRMIKNSEEIEKISHACEISAEALKEVTSEITEGITEIAVASKLACSMLNRGASTFFTGVAFGDNTAVPHHHPSARKLGKNEFVLMDYGAMYQGYWSDITRTFVYGKASEKQVDIHKTVLRAQNIAFDSILEGERGCDVHAKIRDFINSTEYKGKFIHGLGHGLGMNVHDHPAMGNNSEIVLKEGMVVTVEPGIYISDFGGVRIEDDIVVTKSGYDKISHIDTNLTEI